MNEECEDYWLYVIARKNSDGLAGPVKVGISKDVDKRLGSIQTACPFPIDVAWIFELPNRAMARELERMFHEVQKDRCEHGEWFSFDPVTAIQLLCLAFRALVEVSCPENIHDLVLDKAGVFTAERRFPPRREETLQ